MLGGLDSKLKGTVRRVCLERLRLDGHRRNRDGALPAQPQHGSGYAAGNRLVVTGGYTDTSNTPNPLRYYLPFSNGVAGAWSTDDGLWSSCVADVHAGARMAFDVPTRSNVFFGGETNIGGSVVRYGAHRQSASNSTGYRSRPRRGFAAGRPAGGRFGGLRNGFGGTCDARLMRSICPATRVFASSASTGAGMPFGSPTNVWSSRMSTWPICRPSRPETLAMAPTMLPGFTPCT